MNKKAYMQPACEAVVLTMIQTLLAGSDPKTFSIFSDSEDEVEADKIL